MGIDERTADEARAALATLERLSPSVAGRRKRWSVSMEWCHWMHEPVVARQAVDTDESITDGLALPAVEYPVDPRWAESARKIEQVRGPGVFRVGRFWLSGTEPATDDRPDRRVFRPLISRRAEVRTDQRNTAIREFGDFEICELIRGDDRRRLSASLPEEALRELVQSNPAGSIEESELPSTIRSWLDDAAAALGYASPPIRAARSSPAWTRTFVGIGVVVEPALYATDSTQPAQTGSRLEDWHVSLGETMTAFHAVYCTDIDRSPEPHDEGASDTVGPFPLTVQQRRAVAHARRGPITVVSGAPGTGKSHTIVSMVTDALARDETVLVAARSEAAVGALRELFARQPGFMPIEFGSDEHRLALIRELGALSNAPAQPGLLDERWADLLGKLGQRRYLWQRARELLWAASAPSALKSSPPSSHPDHTVHTLPKLVDDVTAARPGWGRRRGWARRRSGALRELRTLLSVDGHQPDEVVVRAAQLALGAAGRGRRFDEVVGDLEVVDREAGEALTKVVAAKVWAARQVDRGDARAIGALATALRMGRSARRSRLAEITTQSLTSAFPLWLGTLGDIDDILPPVPAMFDLVLIDEASSTEQRFAASALLRARRAVIVGDPQQLRPVSFVSDRHREAVYADVDVAPDIAHVLDVRRNTAFDAAAMNTAVHFLDEHFRSVPHLIDVVARDIYGGELGVATRSPLTESVDAVHLVSVDGHRNDDGVVEAEVRAVLTELRLRSASASSVGVIAPFRAQAKAIVDAASSFFTADDMERMNLRIGTVHEFQGMERDDVIVSLGLTDATRSNWRFVNDSHLLAVMLTRGRRQMTMITSCRPDPGTILANYLATADSPPGRPAPVHSLTPWGERLATDLRSAGVDVAPSYPCGNHVIDIVADPARQLLAVIADVHPDGVDAHVERHLALVRLGWTIVDALPSEYDNNPAPVVLDVVARCK